MRRLGKYWKRLHRLVYLASLAVASHGILAIGASKKMFMRDPQAVHELKITFVLLVVLLAVRIPAVRRVLKRLVHQRGPKLKANVPIMPVVVPKQPPQRWPLIYPEDIGVPAHQLPTEPLSAEEVGKQRVSIN
jgi:hypothetical protein